MLQNYLKIAFRNFLKYKTFSIVNLLGLATGAAVFLLLLTYLHFHRSFDRYHAAADRVFRVPMAVQETGSGVEQTFAFTYPAVAPNLQRDFPEIAAAARLRRTGQLVKYQDKVFRESPYFADEAIFQIFSLPFVQGDAATAFKERFSAVLTEETAVKYFGSEDPIGKALDMSGQAFTVRGVLADLPENSHLQFNMLLDYPTYVEIARQFGGDAENSWGWSDFYTYVRLLPGVDAAVVQARLPEFAQKYLGDRMTSEGYEVRFQLQPLLDIHARSDYDYELAGNGNFTFLPMLGVIALLIMLIAWVNFINLSTARSLERSREVGVRKVVGAGRGELIRQFVSEAFLLNVAAFCLGLVMYQLSLPFFAKMAEAPLQALRAAGWSFWAVAGGIFVLGALLSCFYPAFVLSGFRPMVVLQNTLSSTKLGGNARLRKALVVGQFTVAMLLVSGTLAVYKQLQFMRSHELGVSIDHTLVLQESLGRDSAQMHQVEAFLAEVQRIPGVTAASASTDVPGKEIGQSSMYKKVGTEAGKRCRVFGIDEHFIRNYELQMVQGRTFSPNYEADRYTCILNEEAAKVLGFESVEQAIGAEIEDGSPQPLKVIGVLKDYHQESLRFQFNPTVFVPQQAFWGYYSLKTQTDDMAGLMAGVEKAWKQHLGDAPFSHFFLDDFYDRQYRTDRLLGQILVVFTSLIVFVACLGLFGLSSFTVTKRTKEIGVRRILGARTGQIVALISREYLTLVLLASLIAVPLAWFGVRKYLQSFALHEQIGWTFYLLPLLLLAFVAFSTTVFQSIRAALANPVTSLRSE